MRNLKSYNEADASQELRADEQLMPSGGITLSGYDLKFFTAVSDEDFMTKEQKLYYRKQKRKEKYGKR